MSLERILGNFKKKFVPAAMLGLSLACSGSDSGKAPTPTSPYNPPKQAPTTPTTQNPTQQTYPLSNTDISEISDMGYSTISFSSQKSFKVGDIIGSGVTDKTPYGMLREITYVSPDRKTFSTSQTEISKAASEINFSKFVTLNSGSAQLSSSLPGVSFSRSNSQASLGSYNFGMSLHNVVLYDADGDGNTTNDQIILNGSLEFNNDFAMDLDVKDFNLNYFTLSDYFSENADITVGSNILGLATSHEAKITEIKFKPFIMGYIPTAIPIPIIVTPVMGIYAGINPTSFNPFSLRATSLSTLNSSLEYRKGSGWYKDAIFSEDFGFSNPNPGNGLDLSVHVGPRLEFLVYETAGTYVTAAGTLRLNSQNQQWKLYGGVEADLGVEMRFLDKKLAAHAEKVYGTEQLIAQGETGIDTTQIQTKTDTILPTRDAAIHWSSLAGASAMDTNYGSKLELESWKDGGREEKQILMTFPSASFGGKTIQDAKVLLSGYCVGDLDKNISSDIRMINQFWYENNVTWNTKPAYSSNSYGTFVVPASGTIAFREVDVKSLAQDWSNGAPNYGLSLSLKTNPGQCFFASKENPDTSRVPRLIVTYNK